MSLPEMMRSAVLTAALLLPCQALCEWAHANESFQAWPTKEWRTSTPEEQGMGSAALAKLVDYGATHELESMLIVRHGAIVAEAYYAPFRAGVKHRMNSATKSVIGTLVAIALKEGCLSSTDQRAVDFFADRTIANLDDRKRAITIQNLLDMTSGLSWTEPLGDGRPQSMIAMERSADWTQFVLDQPMTAGPGTTFNYSSGNPHLLSAILTKATGESALDYARERLFGPLGISDVFWRQDPQGLSIGGFGLFLGVTRRSVQNCTLRLIDPSDRCRDVALRGFVHERKSMAVRVVEERHPEVVILHGRDEVRLAGEGDPASLKFANSEADVRTAEVDRRAAGSFLRLACLLQQ